MLKARVAVLISGSGTNLQAVLDAQASGAFSSGAVALVVSNRKAAYGLERARGAGVKTAVLSKAMEPDDARRDRKLLALLGEHQIDAVLLAGFLGILGEAVINAYSGRIVNIHPALIPAFCGRGYYGLKVHESALTRGVKVTGATAHLVTSGVDEGPILYQKAVDVLPGDTPEALQRRVMEQAEWILLPRAAEDICAQIIGRRGSV
jgi:phosphoribosylglycinamide formyltransferase-1